MKRNTRKAMSATIRKSMIWKPSKPSPMNMEASRPPAARPASGPNQREAPLAAAGARPGAVGAAAGVVGVAWRVWWIGAEPELLPPPKRLALASRLSVRPTQSASAMLRKRCISGISPVVDCTRVMVHRFPGT
ncbi:hypothetical protein D9M71_593400 [compost metagenome]